MAEGTAPNHGGAPVLRHRTDARLHRAESYPALGDQLDAFMKVFRVLQEHGLQLPADAVAVVEACEAVKARFPKPPAEPASAD